MMVDDAGWVTSRVTCRQCGAEAVAVYEHGTPEDRLECPQCGAQDSAARRVRHDDPATVRRVRENQPVAADDPPQRGR